MIVLTLALLLQATPPTYDGLVALGIAQGREGRTDAAGETLGRAIEMEPGRPEALVERGGLRFLERRYDDAIADLQAALRIRDDAYARDLLASTLLLTGRNDPAIEEWNRLDKPALGKIRIAGLRRAPEAVVRRELAVGEGRRLDIGEYRRTRLRLDESGYFHGLEMRPVVTAPGAVDLEIDVLERHGFGGLPFLVGRGVADLTREKVRLRYANLSTGITVGGEYKWEATQPFLGFTLDAYRPLGFPGMLSIDGLGAHPTYDLEDGSGPFRLRTRGGGARGRVVVASRTVAEAGVRFRDRTWDVARPDTPDGPMLGLQLGIDHTFWSGRRHDLVGSIRTLTAPGFLDGEAQFARALGRVVHHLHVQRPDGLPLEHGSIAAQLTVGYGGEGTPLDEMFAPGAASDMDLPLRGHRLKTSGILGGTPIARSIALFNFEWRQRLVRTRLAQVGYILFYDGGWMGRTARGGDVTLHDVGIGLRVGVRGSVLLRADYGRGLTDGKSTLTAGLGQVF